MAALMNQWRHSSDEETSRSIKAWKMSAREPSAELVTLMVVEIARTRNLYKSNLFRLQLEELIKEMTPRKPPPALEAALHALRPLLLEKLRTRDIPADFAREFPALRFVQRGGAAPSVLRFAPPRRIDVVGSFLLGTYMKDELAADVAVEMPADMFRSKDYLNFRYHDKRAAYLGELHRQLCGGLLQGSEPLVGLTATFEAVSGDPTRPCLCLQPEENARWAIRLLPTYAPDLWPARVLGPDRNAVRPDRSLENGAAPSTAHYNSCVLEDARMRQHLETLHSCLERFTALRDGIFLLKRWARCCGFLAAGSDRAVSTPVSGFLLSMFAAHAANTAGVAPTQTSSFQLFKLTLSFLASTEWSEQKVTFGVAGSAALSAMEAQAATAHFYDADGSVNFLCRVGPVMEELQWEAKRALRAMDSQADPFDTVFGCQATPELTWDLCLRLPELPSMAMCPDLRTEAPANEEATPGLPPDLPEALAVAQRLRCVLRAGLDDRCVRAAVRWVGSLCPRWAEHLPETGVAVLIGLILAPEHLERVVDRGPSAQDAAATKFRQLWGTDRSELRRFKDGSILECVVWEKPPAERSVETPKQPAVVTQIVRHLLTRHLPASLAPKTDIVSGPTGFVANLGEKDRRLWATFETFRTHLCQLSSLPLAVKDIHPVDASFSYMAIQSTFAPPAPSGSDAALRRTLHATVLEFESSGRWPSEPAPAQKVATALLLQIREELSSDLGIEADATEGFLDVRYPDAVFRLRIFHPHELQEVANKATGLQATSSTPPSEPDLERLRALWWRPRLRASLHAHAPGLQKPAMAGAVRLFKRWMASQMMSGYDEPPGCEIVKQSLQSLRRFCEHLVCAVFLHPAPFDAPSSPHVGFCRALWLLDSFDWQRDTGLSSSFAVLLASLSKERLGLRQSFENHLATAQKLGLCKMGASYASGRGAESVSTRLDPHALLLATPPSTVAAWLRRRAQEALRCFHARVLGGEPNLGVESNWRGIFELDTSAFDVVLQLQPPLEDRTHAAETQNGDEAAAAMADSSEKEGHATVKMVSVEAAEALVQGGALNERGKAKTFEFEGLWVLEPEAVQGLREKLSPVCLVFHDAQQQVLALKWRHDPRYPELEAQRFPSAASERHWDLSEFFAQGGKVVL
ncbi:Nol6 [Symbiodinium natans]|uniref:Nol6 protein n=1 Tax=Symbiodinium natans TaxID=878477 RepID=A0A812UTH7_9DINO|nr:Nol6 [Symbiodinium natans]